MDQEHTALSGFTLFLNLNNKYNMKLANLLDELIYFFDSETVCPSPVVQKPQQMPIFCKHLMKGDMQSSVLLRFKGKASMDH